MKRHSVNKRSAARSFNKSVGKTKAINIAPRPMRGGYRL